MGGYGSARAQVRRDRGRPMQHDFFALCAVEPASQHSVPGCGTGPVARTIRLGLGVADAGVGAALTAVHTELDVGPHSTVPACRVDDATRRCTPPAESKQTRGNSRRVAGPSQVVRTVYSAVLRAATFGIALLTAGCACDRIAEADSTYGCWAGYGAARSDASGRVLTICEEGPERRALTYLANARPAALHGLLPRLVVPDSSGSYIVVSSLLTRFTVWESSARDPIHEYEVRSLPVDYDDVVVAEEPGCWICVPSFGPPRGAHSLEFAPLQLITADGRHERFGAPPIDGVTHIATYCNETRDVFILTTPGTIFVVNRDDRGRDWIGTIGFAPKQFGAAVVGAAVYVARGASLVGFDLNERRVFDVPQEFDGEVASISSAVGDRFVIGVTLERSTEQTRSQLICCEVRPETGVSVLWRQMLPKNEWIGDVVYLPKWGGTVVMSPDGPPRFIPFPEDAAGL